MIKGIKILLVAIILIANSPISTAQSSSVIPLTLQQAIEYAVANNEMMKNIRLDEAYAAKEVRQYKSDGFPQINGSISYQNFPALPTSLIPAEFLGGNPGEFAELQFGTSQNMKLNIAASQMLFNGTFFFGLRAAKKYVDFTERKLDQKVWELKSTISKAYYAALVTEQTKKIIDKNVSSIEKIYYETSELYKSGFIEEIEVDRLNLSLTNVKAQQKNIGRQVRLSYGLLKFQMGMPITDSIVLTDVLENIEFVSEALLTGKNALEHRIDYQLLSQQAELLDYQIMVTRAGYYPKADLIASYDENAQRNEFDFFDFDKEWYTTFLWGINISIPIYDGGRKSSAIQKTRIQIDQVRNQQIMLKNSIAFEVEKTRAEYLNAIEELEAQKKNLALAEKIFNIVVTKYNEGVGSSIELNNAETTLFLTQTNYLNALYSTLISKADLEKALGF